MKGLAQAGMAVVLVGTMILTGCSTDWTQEAEQIVAAMIPAAANLVTLVAALQGKTVSAEDLAMIQSAGTQAGADLQLIESLIAAYEKANASAKPGILSQIQSAVNAVQAKLQGLLPALHIKDGATQAKIVAVVGILLSEVQSIAALVPVVQGEGVQVAARVKLSPQGTQGSTGETQNPRTPLSARGFVKAYNSTLTAKTGNGELDRAAAGLQIHLHGAAARWASGGLLQ
ncbi:MAG TPA: hypothetical protein VGS27_12600 [Candidatus Sulfotelmatobacter sp.]|nr:hypothetical protein [Candidatus Sulfotelmatobacter sp.]